MGSSVSSQLERLEWGDSSLVDLQWDKHANGVKLSRKELVSLCGSLGQNHWLRTLNLSQQKHRIGIEGCRLLSAALRSNRSLRSLQLDRCNLGDEGIFLVTSGITPSLAICSLSFRDNGISSLGARGLVEAALANMPALTILNLAANPIADTGAEAVADLVRMHDRLASVDLSSVGCGEGGGSALAAALRHGRSPLRVLKLEGNTRIGKQHREEMETILKTRVAAAVAAGEPAEPEIGAFNPPPLAVGAPLYAAPNIQQPVVQARRNLQRISRSVSSSSRSSRRRSISAPHAPRIDMRPNPAQADPYWPEPQLQRGDFAVDAIDVFPQDLIAGGRRPRKKSISAESAISEETPEIKAPAKVEDSDDSDSSSDDEEKHVRGVVNDRPIYGRKCDVADDYPHDLDENEPKKPEPKELPAMNESQRIEAIAQGIRNNKERRGSDLLIEDMHID